MKPADIRPVEGGEILIIWENGERSLLTAREVQFACQCARCVDEWTGERMIREDQVDPEVRMLRAEPVGRYAVKFRWSTGCQNGIYPFDYLYSLAGKRRSGGDGEPESR